jgi:hypothetical protein
MGVFCKISRELKGQLDMPKICAHFIVLSRVPNLHNPFKRGRKKKYTYRSIGVNLDGLHSQSRNLRNILILSLTFLLLQLEGNTTDGTALNTLHQVGGETGNLVAETLGGNDGHLVANLLVDLEVEGETGIVLFNNDSGGLLDGFSSNTTLEYIHI